MVEAPSLRISMRSIIAIGIVFKSTKEGPLVTCWLLKGELVRRWPLISTRVGKFRKETFDSPPYPLFDSVPRLLFPEQYGVSCFNKLRASVEPDFPISLF